MYMDKFMDKDIYQYISNYVELNNNFLKKIEYKGKLLGNADMSVGYEVGKFLSMLVHIKQAKSVLEIGTCIGFSSVWLATALTEVGGSLTSIEYDRQFCDFTRKHLKAAGVDKCTQIMEGDASKIVKELKGPYDIIFQDSDKNLYPVMLDDCINLVKVGGIIVADDTLFKKMGVEGAYGDAVEEYNQLVKEKDNLCSMVLPIGSGITLSVRVK